LTAEEPFCRFCCVRGYRVYKFADDDLVEEFATALDDVQVTVSDGVKRTGVDGRVACV
jgi:hypothetical protein